MDVQIKTLAPFALDGRVVRPGEVVTVARAVARDLVHRGRALPATEPVDDLAPALDEMTDDELRGLASDYGIEGLPKRYARDKWIDALRAYEATMTGLLPREGD